MLARGRDGYSGALREPRARPPSISAKKSSDFKVIKLSVLARMYFKMKCKTFAKGS